MSGVGTVRPVEPGRPVEAAGPAAHPVAPPAAARAQRAPALRLELAAKETRGAGLDPSSMVEVRTMHGLGLLAFEEDDWDLARHWWTQAAEGGHVRSMVALAVIAEQEGDLDEARSWWELAAAGGDGDAMYSLGLLDDRAGDWESARTWWRRSAQARLSA